MDQDSRDSSADYWEVSQYWYTAVHEVEKQLAAHCKFTFT